MSAPNVQDKFDAAVRVIQSLPKNDSFQPSNEMFLRFYSLYKQANFGECREIRPGFWDVVGRTKWDAWNGLGDMSSEAAMLCYVEELKKVIETMPHTPDVSMFLEKLGSFYELVDEDGGSKRTDDSGLDSLTETTSSILLANHRRGEQNALANHSGDEQTRKPDHYMFTKKSLVSSTTSQEDTAQQDEVEEDQEEDEFCDSVDCITDEPCSFTVPPVDAGAAASSSPSSATLVVPPPAVSPEISAALQRLQVDVQLVLRRLTSLESLMQRHLAAAAAAATTPPASSRAPPPPPPPMLSSWWPFGSVDRRTVLLILVWPLVVNWIIKA